MTQIKWRNAWDELYQIIRDGKNSLGKNELLRTMEQLERQAVREAEQDDES